MAIESKSSKLICLSLVSVQKLVAADAIALEGLLIVIQDMEQVIALHAVLCSVASCTPSFPMLTGHVYR